MKRRPAVTRPEEALFPLPSGPRPSITAQINCIKREIEFRRSTYPVLVRHGRMRRSTAEREIRAMCAALESLQAFNDRAPELRAAVAA